MTKIYNIAASLAMVATMAGFCSCDGTENVPYSPAPQPEGQRVYFGSMTQNEEVADDATELNVAIYRPAAVAADAFTVQLLTTDESGLFNVPTEVTFAAGDTAAVVPVHFEASKLVSGQHYRVVITVDEAQANEYGISTTTLTVTRLSWTEWTEFGEGTYTFTLWYEGDAPAKVMERHLTDDDKTAQYQFLVNLDEDNPDSYELYLTASTDDGGASITVAEQKVGEHPAYGDVFLSDTYTYTGDPSYQKDSNFDSETGLFTLNLVCYCDAGVFGDGNEYCQLDGYVDDREYTLKLTDAGMVDVGGKDYAIVRLEMNENLEQVRYVVADGALTEAEIADVVTKIEQDDPSLTAVIVRSSGNLALSPTYKGKNTIVAVGYNSEGEVKATASLTFDYGQEAKVARIAPHRLKI